MKQSNPLSDTPTTAVVLCGGLGSRLRAAVSDRPKVLAPIAGKPLLEHQLRRLEDLNFHRVILSAGYRAEAIEEFVGGWESASLRVEVLVEPLLLGTGGAIAFAARRKNLKRAFYVLNGDTLANINYKALWALHKTHRNALATIALVQIEDRAAYGSVAIDGAGRVVAFTEKVAISDDDKASPGWINAGVYILEPEALATVHDGHKVSIERDLFPTWAGTRLYALADPAARLLDVGTPDDYARASTWMETHGWQSQQ